MWIGLGCRTRNRRDIFFLFSRPSHGTHLDLSSLSSQSSKSVLNDERIVFSCQWKSSIETSKIWITWQIARGREFGFELSIAIIIIKHDDEFYLKRWNIIVCMSFIVNWALITPILFYFFFAALFWSVKFSFDFNL